MSRLSRKLSAKVCSLELKNGSNSYNISSQSSSVKVVSISLAIFVLNLITIILGSVHLLEQSLAHGLVERVHVVRLPLQVQAVLPLLNVLLLHRHQVDFAAALVIVDNLYEMVLCISLLIVDCHPEVNECQALVFVLSERLRVHMHVLIQLQGVLREKRKHVLDSFLKEVLLKDKRGDDPKLVFNSLDHDLLQDIFLVDRLNVLDSPGSNIIFLCAFL
jgi:hypothetical protein